MSVSVDKDTLIMEVDNDIHFYNSARGCGRTAVYLKAIEDSLTKGEGKMTEKNLWIMCGVPGSGKSYVAKTLMRNNGWAYVSRDEVRFRFLADDEEYFAHENEVYEVFVYEVAQALKSPEYKNVIADATHLNYGARHKLLEALARELDLDDITIIPIVVHSDLDTCLARNKERTGREHVPVDVIRRMWKSFEHPSKDKYHYDGILDWSN